MSALLAERGFEATSPTMVLQRSGAGHGSLYHHYRGKEALALDAISHMHGHTITFLERQAHPSSSGEDTDADSVHAGRLEAESDKLLATHFACALDNGDRRLANQAFYDRPRRTFATMLHAANKGRETKGEHSISRCRVFRKDVWWN